MTVRCSMCGLHFRVEEPHGNATERLMCPEKGCHRPFWCVSQAGTPKRSIVGMTPTQFEVFYDTAPWFLGGSDAP